MKIDTNKRQEWECHLFDKNGNMLSIWIGHMLGDFYGNFSFRDKHYNFFQMKRGFHLRKELFLYYLSMPLNWVNIIDVNIKYGENMATHGINLKTGEFKIGSNKINELSK